MKTMKVLHQTHVMPDEVLKTDANSIAIHLVSGTKFNITPTDDGEGIVVNLERPVSGGLMSIEPQYGNQIQIK